MGKEGKRMYEKEKAIILYLLKRIKNIPGRKAFQKLIYFISEKIPLSFDFRLYWFGPYSRELSNVLDDLILRNLVVIKSGDSYPQITLTNELSVEKFIASNLSSNERRYIEDIVEIFKNCSPRELELLATIHFICKHTYGIEKLTDDEIVKIVKSIKGAKFSDDEIRKAIEFLKKNKMITI